ncbi:hypothetical protein Tco_0649767 [Tanacetum coccineum]
MVTSITVLCLRFLFPGMQQILLELTYVAWVDGVMSFWELNAVDTKLRSAPVSKSKALAVFWAVSSKVALSSALKATIALLIIVVVVTVVVVVVVIGRPDSTVLGRMANPLAVIAPRPGLCSASYSVGFDCSWKDHHTFFSFLPDVQHRHGQATDIRFNLSISVWEHPEHIKAVGEISLGGGQYWFDRMDLKELYNLVMQRFATTTPEGIDLIL